VSHNPGFLALVDEARPRVTEITAEEVADLQRRGLPVALLDVREDHEWDKGHPAGASHLGRGILERDIEYAAPDRDAPLVLMCGGGYRSILAADSLQRMGYRRVFSLAGGWRAWCAAGLPIVGAPAAP
jgi:rhodanese-related sulfurtransferase